MFQDHSRGLAHRDARQLVHAALERNTADRARGSSIALLLIDCRHGTELNHVVATLFLRWALARRVDELPNDPADRGQKKQRNPDSEGIVERNADEGVSHMEEVTVGERGSVEVRQQGAAPVYDRLIVVATGRRGQCAQIRNRAHARDQFRKGLPGNDSGGRRRRSGQRVGIC